MASAPPWETARLRVREAVPADMATIEALFAGNRQFVELRGDIAGRAGGYDPEAVHDYCSLAMLDPTRLLLAVEDKRTSETVGIVDCVASSPADLLPWIGLVLIGRTRQRAGLGTEVVSALIEHFRAHGAQAVRVGVMAANSAGLAFVRSLGFEPFETSSAEMGPERSKVLLLEAPLSQR